MIRPIKPVKSRLQLVVDKLTSRLSSLQQTSLLCLSHQTTDLLLKGSYTMILADKIIKLRKQFAWSQEELAEKMGVSRQSVSKWESANSIPDLNKILKLSEIFGVSTDYLVKDEIEEASSIQEDKEPGILKVTLDEAMKYVSDKIAMAKLTSIGVLFVIGSIIPLFFLYAMAESESPSIGGKLATVIGLVMLFVMVPIGVSFFIGSSQYTAGFEKYEKEDVELVYGVRSIIKEKLDAYKSTYTTSLSISIMLLITSVVPLIVSSVMGASQSLILMMVVLLLVMVSLAVFTLIRVTSKYEAYSRLVGEGDYAPSKRQSNERVEKIATIYWPLITAVYIGWSLWTMHWGSTWIIWPVAAIAFGAIVGISGLVKDQ